MAQLSLSLAMIAAEFLVIALAFFVIGLLLAITGIGAELDGVGHTQGTYVMEIFWSMACAAGFLQVAFFGKYFVAERSSSNHSSACLRIAGYMDRYVDYGYGGGFDLPCCREAK